MALGIVAIGVMTYVAVNRPPPPGFTAPRAAETTIEATSAPSASATESSSSTPTPTRADEESRVLVVGDAFTAASGSGGEGPAGWPQLVADRLEDDGSRVTVDVAAADGSGYVQGASGGATFEQLAEGAGEDYDLVVFAGSRHDTAAAPEVQAAARAAFVAAREASPDASLLVIGPVWADGEPPGYILTNRDATRAAAASLGVPFIDPVAEEWLADEPAALAPDGDHPTDEGHRKLADRVLPRIEEALAGAP
jgi:lysophospholipase L1-like esterase